VHTVVVVAGQKPADRGVELGQSQACLPGPVWGAARGVAGHRREAHLVDAVHEALDLAPAAGLAGQGEHQPDLQLGGHLLQVVGGEIRAVVGVEDTGNAAHVPAWLGLAPDRLPQCQSGLQR
jgi:hypothetical protein